MALSIDSLSVQLYIDEVQNLYEKKNDFWFGIDPNFANKKLNKKKF